MAANSTPRDHAALASPPELVELLQAASQEGPGGTLLLGATRRYGGVQASSEAIANGTMANASGPDDAISPVHCQPRASCAGFASSALST